MWIATARKGTVYECETEDCMGQDFGLRRDGNGVLWLVCSECAVGRDLDGIMRRAPTRAPGREDDHA